LGFGDTKLVTGHNKSSISDRNTIKKYKIIRLNDVKLYIF